MKEGLWHLIIVVLLASLIDVCAPSGSMRRYVRLVLSLLVLLALLSPIAALWRIDVHGALRKALSHAATDDVRTPLQDVQARGDALHTMLSSTAQTHASDIVARAIVTALHDRGYVHATASVQLPTVSITLGMRRVDVFDRDDTQDIKETIASWITERWGIARSDIVFL